MKNQVKTSKIKKYRANHRVYFETNYEEFLEHYYDVVEAENKIRDYYK